MTTKELALQKHYEWRGKLETAVRSRVRNAEDLTLAYTPGVAEPCLEIQKDINKSYELTRRWNTVAVITNGTAVLGLGDIGPEAGMPVMEGKCVLFKEFGDVDAIPLCVRSKSIDEIVNTCALLAGSFGGINLEDIAAPDCFEIERRLQERCDIPVFHDDQHGTAIVVGGALINALKLAGKKPENCRMVISGAGAAGSAIARFMLALGIGEIIMNDREGLLSVDDPNVSPARREIASLTNPNHVRGTIADGLRGADIFVGVSAPGLVTSEMVASMNEKSIVFSMANPVPEIMPEDSKKGGAFIIGTGRSDYPNQINNVLAFPGVFRGALDVRASRINEEMKLAAAHALADFIPESELSPTRIIPGAFEPGVGAAVGKAVAEAARRSGVARA